MSHGFAERMLSSAHAFATVLQGGINRKMTDRALCWPWSERGPGPRCLTAAPVLGFVRSVTRPTLRFSRGLELMEVAVGTSIFIPARFSATWLWTWLASYPR